MAELARGKMVVREAALAEALTGQIEDHHAFLCRTLLDTIDYLGGQIETLTTRTTTALHALPCPDTDGNLRAGPGPDLMEKLVTISGVGLRTTRCCWPSSDRTCASSPPPTTSSRGRSSPPDHPVRREEHQRTHREGEPLGEERGRRGGAVGLPVQHLPRRPLPTLRQAPRPQESPGRGRPFTPGHRLASTSDLGQCSALQGGGEGHPWPGGAKRRSALRLRGDGQTGRCWFSMYCLTTVRGAPPHDPAK
jgi:hypothetical protein